MRERRTGPKHLSGLASFIRRRQARPGRSEAQTPARHISLLDLLPHRCEVGEELLRIRPTSDSVAADKKLNHEQSTLVLHYTRAQYRMKRGIRTLRTLRSIRTGPGEGIKTWRIHGCMHAFSSEPGGTKSGTNGTGSNDDKVQKTGMAAPDSFSPGLCLRHIPTESHREHFKVMCDLDSGAFCHWDERHHVHRTGRSLSLANRQHFACAIAANGEPARQ